MKKGLLVTSLMLGLSFNGHAQGPGRLLDDLSEFITYSFKYTIMKLSDPIRTRYRTNKMKKEDQKFNKKQKEIKQNLTK